MHYVYAVTPTLVRRNMIHFPAAVSSACVPAVCFSAIDLNNFGQTNFRYMLEGLQTEWVSAGKNHRAAFVNLQPGEYTFRVRPEDAGEDSFYDATLKFVVTDYFWQRSWFKFSGIALLAGLLISLAFMENARRLRLRNLRLQARISIQEERNRISRDLHDDLGSSLGAISLLSDIALTKTNQKELRTEIRKIAESAHELSEKIHEIIWAANPKNDTMERFVSYLHQYAVSLMGDGNYDLKAQIPKDIPATAISGEHPTTADCPRMRVEAIRDGHDALAALAGSTDPKRRDNEGGP